MKTTPETPEASGTQEESVEFDMATMDLNTSLATYLAEPGDQKTLIPLSRLSTSARNVLLKVLHRAQGEVTHPDDEFRLEALEEITVQHLKDARNVGSTKANEFLGELNQQYATKVVLESAVQQGFAIEQQETLEDGTVRIVIGRWS